MNPLPRPCDLECQIPGGGGASRVTQTDPFSLEPVGTLEHCLGWEGMKESRGGQRILAWPFFSFGSLGLRLCKPSLPWWPCPLHCRSVERAPFRSTPGVCTLLGPPSCLPCSNVSVPSPGPSPLLPLPTCLTQADPEPTYHIPQCLPLCLLILQK